MHPVKEGESDISVQLQGVKLRGLHRNGAQSTQDQPFSYN